MSLPGNFDIMAACPTVFNNDQTINYEETAQIPRFLERIGIHSIAVLLFGGEYYRLSLSEKGEIIDLIRHSSNWKGKLIVGINDNSLNAMIELSRLAKKSDADAVVVSPPAYVPFYRYGRKFVESFLRKLLEKVDQPVIFQDTELPEDHLPSLKFWKNYVQSNVLYGFKIEGRNSLKKIRTIRKTYQDAKIYGGYLGINIPKEIKAGSNGSIIGSAIPDIVIKSMFYQNFSMWDTLTRFLKFEVHHMSEFVEIEKYLLMKRGVITRYTSRDPSPHLSWRLIDELDRFYLEFGL